MNKFYNIPELKRLQQKYNNPAIMIFIATLLLIASIGFMASTGSGKNSGDAEGLVYLPIALIIYIPLIIYLGFQSEKAKRNFTAQYKTTLVQSLFSKYFDNARFTEGKGFHDIDVKTFHLSKTSNVFWSGNYASGEYMGVPFEQADVIIEHDDIDGAVLNQDKYEGVEPYFNGRITVFHFPEDSIEGVHAHTRNFKYAPTTYQGQDLQDVSMDGTGFNQSFITTAVLEQDANQVLIQPMIDKLLELAKQNDSVTVFFSKGTMYLGIEGIEYDFTPSPSQPVTLEDDKKKIENDIQIIRDIIEIIVQPIM